MRRLVAGGCAAVAALVTAAPAGAIVNGQETQRDWPWMARMDPAGVSIGGCGGTLVTPRHVLTAGHCLSSYTTGGGTLTSVTLGRRKRTDLSGGEQIRVVGTAVHPKYVEGDLHHDAALLELAAPAKAAPIQVAGPHEAALQAAGVVATVLGWGTTSDGGALPSIPLMEAQVPIVEDAVCTKLRPDFAAGYFSPAHTLCAGFPDQGGPDACNQDSGGPLVSQSGNGWRLIGIVSYGDGCGAPNKPGYYTRAGAPEIADWIEANAPGAVVKAPPPAAAEPKPKKPKKKKKKKRKRR